MTKTKHRTDAKGVRVRLVNNIMVVVALVASAVLLLLTFEAVSRYSGLQEATERYIACQQAADDFRSASDYLTNESRCFVANGELEHAQNYADEIEVQKRREGALEVLREYFGENQASYDHLTEALTASNSLAEDECYAMRLALDVYGISPSEAPELVSSVEIADGDAALSTEDKYALSMNMMFGDSYMEKKNQIYADVDLSVNALVSDLRAQQMDRASAYTQLLHRQQILIVAVLVMLFGVAFLTRLMVFKPLETGVKRMRQHEQIPPTGAYEIQYLANTYNEMVEQQRQHTEELSYSATHDALTGVFNRTAFEAMLPAFDQSAIAALIIDVDFFKQFNDQYGHDMGDRVLKKVAEVIQKNFRQEDCVFRIGGDEFCVIMVRANSKLTDLVLDKARRMNEILQNPDDGMPPVSLSIGAAFGDRENLEEDIIKDADKALYAVKRKERGNCAVYGQDT